MKRKTCIPNTCCKVTFALRLSIKRFDTHQRPSFIQQQLCLCLLPTTKTTQNFNMFKLFAFACFLALAAAKPGVFPVAYTAPVAAAYTAPVAAAYTAPVAYTAYSAYSAPVAAYSAYPYASPYSYYLRR
ncbi:unnamed protein product [Leptosia nina]|uniref:Uncharacterized protein n=1 Tax=Leptosia nina TaxID=320188 RepID=A0AAV1K3Z2_9NEOP